MAQYVYTMHRLSKVVPPKREILKNISLSFFPGAKIGVLGLNGAGKSTLLRIMAGVDTEFDGEARAMPGINVGYLPQEPQLDPSKTVRDVVEEAVSQIKDAQARLDQVYAAYAEPDADFDALEPAPRIYLFTVKALGYLHARLGRQEEGRALLEKVAELDPADRIGVRPLSRFVAKNGITGISRSENR